MYGTGRVKLNALCMTLNILCYFKLKRQLVTGQGFYKIANLKNFKKITGRYVHRVLITSGSKLRGNCNLKEDMMEFFSCAYLLRNTFTWNII